MFEDMLSALQNFRQNKMRTLLSLLGIMIGVSSVVITMNLSSSLEASIAQEFKDLSNSILSVRPQSWRNRNIIFNNRYAEALQKQIPEIKNTFLFDAFNATVQRGRLSAGSKECFGIDYGYIEANKWELEYGEPLILSDFISGARKVIIGEDIAKGLFPEGNAVGKTLSLSVPNGNAAPLLFTCTVKGVLKKRKTTMGQISWYVLLPRAFLVRQLGHKNEGSRIEVEVYDTVTDFKAVETAIKEVSDTFANTSNAVRVWSPASMQQQIQGSLAMISAVLSGNRYTEGNRGYYRSYSVSISNRISGN